MIRKQFDDEIEKILDYWRMGHHKKNRRIEYLVKWKRGKDNEVSWERDIDLWQFEKIVQEYISTISTNMSGSSSAGAL
ncbi:hypothetical protein Pint_30332 [Pistacia integerrima]|uniref:Uncharacterized protein n=1 Tax=Pistacia integerrima TaxID=434235 RepID=A0ACC0X238_9ROSI|nr:hypothetical protein Pint_30332 [Pistacia integerrima]